MPEPRNLKSCRIYCRDLAENKLVEINGGKLAEVVEKFSEELKNNPDYFEIPGWNWQGYPDSAKEFIEHQAYAASGDALFWFTKDNGEHTGEWGYGGAMRADAWHRLILDLMEEGKVKGEGGRKFQKISNYMATLSLDEFTGFLKNDENKDAVKLEMKEKRVENLNEVGRVLSEKYDGEFENFLDECEWSAPKIVKRLAEEFPKAYGEDCVDIGDETVYFDKRNNLVPILLYGGLIARKAPKKISGMGGITIASDYRIPEALRAMGILKYSKELADKIDRGVLIEKGSPEEVAIRAASLVAAQEIIEGLNKKGYDIHAAHMDAYLWYKGRKAKTHHRTKTMAY